MDNTQNRLFHFYQSFDCGETLLPYNLKTLNRIIEINPKSVLEFGCNNGKNLQYLKERLPQTADVFGIDFSMSAIMKAAKKGLDVKLGDENALKNISDKKYDVIFTISVLDHMPNIENTLKSFERIAKKAVFLTETNDIVTELYFAHDYISKGYMPKDYTQNPQNPIGNGALYVHYEKLI